METPQPSAAAALIIEVLKSRDGLPTVVTLKDGRAPSVLNIAWGQDFGDPEYHVTSNISPAPAVTHAVDIFSTGDVASISDPTSRAVEFERGVV
jgi:hypothetical protein